MTTEDVFNAALDLPERDRFDLVNALISTFDTDARLEFDEFWRTVIEHRSAELRDGAVQAASWEDLKRLTRELLDE